MELAIESDADCCDIGGGGGRGTSSSATTPVGACERAEGQSVCVRRRSAMLRTPTRFPLRER
jgi:hypothetical protein